MQYGINICFGNDLLPLQHQTITWIITDLLSIASQGTNFMGIKMKIETYFHSRKQCMMELVLHYTYQLTHYSLVIPYGYKDIDQQWLMMILYSSIYMLIYPSFQPVTMAILYSCISILPFSL